jgi:glucose-1-phosphate thymidylyltransferase
MKGVILAGGQGTRLLPLTTFTNKHLLPVYDKQMILYPLEILLNAGIKDIMIITGSCHAGNFMELLGSGEKFKASFTYKIQDKSGGIAHALLLAEDFVNGDYCAVILGDNLIFDDISKELDYQHDPKAHFFLKHVDNPKEYGVAKIDKDKKLESITEKPENPPTDLAVIGLYIYDITVFDKLRMLKPSIRGEFEISEVNDMYIKEGHATYSILQNEWFDMGTHEGLIQAGRCIHDKQITND